MNLRRILGLEKKSSASLYEVMIGASGGLTSMSVSRETAMGLPVVFACMRVIAEGLAQVPWRLYQTAADGRRTEVQSHPLSALIRHAPNGWQTSFEFRETMALHASLTGNAYVLVVRNQLGEVQELLPFSPELVRCRQNTDWTISYSIQKPGGGLWEPQQSEIWHLRGPGWNGFAGLSFLEVARKAILLAASADQFGSLFFSNGARPSGIIRPRQDMTFTPEQALAAKQAWMEAHGGGGQLGVAFLNGLEYQPISTKPDEAQFMETRRHQVIEICRAFRVAPFMVMHLDGANYSSSEQMLLAHDVHTLGPWFARFVESANMALLTPQERAEGLHLRLDDKGLLRGSAKERAEYHSIALQHGWETINEVRAIEGLPILDGDLFNSPRPAANLYGPQSEEG